MIVVVTCAPEHIKGTGPWDSKQHNLSALTELLSNCQTGHDTIKPPNNHIPLLTEINQNWGEDK